MWEGACPNAIALCRSELAREKRTGAAFNQETRLIVDVFREQARSYKSLKGKPPPTFGLIGCQGLRTLVSSVKPTLSSRAVLLPASSCSPSCSVKRAICVARFTTKASREYTPPSSE